jgi:hypothetical protein
LIRKKRSRAPGKISRPQPVAADQADPVAAFLEAADPDKDGTPDKAEYLPSSRPASRPPTRTTTARWI